MSRRSRINSSPPSAAYMRHRIGSALVQIMACRLFGAKPLSKPMIGFVNWELSNRILWIFNQNTELLIHENASENIVCEMSAILSRENESILSEFIRETNWAIITPADVPAPNGARPSADTVLAIELHMFFTCLFVISNHHLLIRWRHSKWPTPSRGRSRVEPYCLFTWHPGDHLLMPGCTIIPCNE